VNITPEKFKELLISKGLTIVAAESATAGLFASTIASVQGASGILKGSIVTYNQDMKTAFLGVRESTLAVQTAESMETTREMVEGLRNAYHNSSIYIAVTGVASPSTPQYHVDKPLGQMYVCCWMNGKVHEFNEIMTGSDRNEIRQQAVNYMMEIVCELIENNGPTSLYNQIKKLDEPDWNYYFGNPGNTVLIDKPFVTRNPSKSFIKEYFRKGGKEWITEAFNLNDFLQPRADHTVAVFFFGAMLIKHTGFNQKKFYERKVEKWYNFELFMWFVTCLAHDAAFYLEKDKGLFSNAATVEELYAHLKIDYKLIEKEIAAVPSDFWANVKSYFTYRHDVIKLTDHGIYAGILAFDVLVKNRIKQHEQAENSLYWAEDLDPFYAIAAATIATHNMWIPETPEQIEEYRQAGLDQLIGRNPINFKESPVLYFLGLIDTIDPVKAYWEIPVLEVLENIYIDYAPDSLTMTVTGRLDPAVVIDKAHKAQAWLAITYEPLERGVFIKFQVD